MMSERNYRNSPENFKVACKGRPCAAIVLGKDHIGAEKHAAEELRKYIYEISAADVPIYIEGDKRIGEFENLFLIGGGNTNALIKNLIEREQVALSCECPGLDGFVIKSAGNCLVLGGSRPRGTIYAVYHLLEKYMKVGFFWDGDAIHKSDTLTLPEINISERPAFRYRFSKSGSECNSTYSFADWWGFEEWKKEIDWMMKNKVNIAVITCGANYVRKLTYNELGVPCEPINEDDTARMEIAKKIYEYCRTVDLDIAGRVHSTEVPHEFEKTYPGARYYRAKWDANTSEDLPGGAPPNLFPWDPVYKKLIKTYVKTWNTVYGKVHMYLAEMPAEARIEASCEDIRRIYVSTPKDFYEAVKEVDPEAIIYIDGWMMRYDSVGVWRMKDAVKDFIDNMPYENSVFLDLWPEWKLGGPIYKEKRFEYVKNRKFILSFLNEFGGNDYLHGCYDTAIKETKELLVNEEAKNCVGVGNSTEVMYFNVNYYDLMFRLAWNPANVEKTTFVEEQAVRRYGPLLAGNERMKEAFKLFIDAVHTGQITSEAYYQRRILLHPYGYRSMPRFCSRKAVKKLERYFNKALPVPEEGKGSKHFLNDLYDAMRQYITELANIHIYGIHDAYMIKSIDLFDTHSKALLFLMDKLETLVKSNKRWHIEEEVKKLEGHTPETARYYHVKSAEAIGKFIRDKGLTFAVFCPDSLLDYPGKDYYELIKYYYRPRVETFVNYIREIIEETEEPSTSKIEEKLKELYRPIEVKWVEEGYNMIGNEIRPEPIWKVVEEIYAAINSCPDVQFRKENDCI